MKNFKDVCIKKNTIEYLNDIKKKALLVYSRTSAKKLDLLSKVNIKI